VTPDQRKRAFSMLRHPIPPAYRPPPKPQGSWQRLKAGQRLRGLKAFVVGSTPVPVGADWSVELTTSAGATLTTVTNDGKLVRLAWSQVEWEATFERVTTRRKRTTSQGQRSTTP
jgi:hypothetical protein